jgi:HAE1 family hydrophobic/amphiphilic exporter-1
MRSMAVVMISGMVISTVVTLLFTPVYYSLLDGMSQNFADRHKKRRESRVQNQ